MRCVVLGGEGTGLGVAAHPACPQSPQLVSSCALEARGSPGIAAGARRAR